MLQTGVQLSFALIYKLFLLESLLSEGIQTYANDALA
jgi:hypothetical protein